MRETIFFFSGLPMAFVVVPYELDRGVVGLRARIGEEDLGHRRRRECDQPLGKLDARLVRLVAE